MAEVTADSSSARFVAVAFDGSNPPKVQTPTFDGERVIGITPSAYDSGENLQLQRDVGEDRTVKWTCASGTPEEGDLLAADTDGKAIVAEDGYFVAALALQDSDGAGHEIEVIPLFDVRAGDFHVTVGSESNDIIPLTIQTPDGVQRDIEAQLLEDAGGDTGLQLVSDASATGQDLTAGANGTALAGGGAKRGLFQTDTSGALDLDVNDNSGSLSGDRFVKLIPEGGKRSYIFKVTFA